MSEELRKMQRNLEELRKEIDEKEAQYDRAKREFEYRKTMEELAESRQRNQMEFEKMNKLIDSLNQRLQRNSILLDEIKTDFFIYVNVNYMFGHHNLL